MNEEFEFDGFDTEVDGPELNEDFDLDTDDEYLELEYDHDDMYDVESALGSAGWGTDEYYNDWDYSNDY